MFAAAGISSEVRALCFCHISGTRSGCQPTLKGTCHNFAILIHLMIAAPTNKFSALVCKMFSDMSFKTIIAVSPTTSKTPVEYRQN